MTSCVVLFSYYTKQCECDAIYPTGASFRGYPQVHHMEAETQSLVWTRRSSLCVKVGRLRGATNSHTAQSILGPQARIRKHSTRWAQLSITCSMSCSQCLPLLLGALGWCYLLLSSRIVGCCCCLLLVVLDHWVAVRCC